MKTVIGKRRRQLRIRERERGGERWEREGEKEREDWDREG